MAATPARSQGYHSLMSRPRFAIALALAAAGLGPSARVLLGFRWDPPRPFDAAQEADRLYGSAHAWLPSRVGFCADVPRDVIERISPNDRMEWRVAQRFRSQYALAPTICVAVLGQPSNGQRDPSETNRTARLAELDTVLVLARPDSSCWEGAVEAGFHPIGSAGPAVIFRRWAR